MLNQRNLSVTGRQGVSVSDLLVMLKQLETVNPLQYEISVLQSLQLEYFKIHEEKYSLLFYRS